MYEEHYCFPVNTDDHTPATGTKSETGKLGNLGLTCYWRSLRIPFLCFYSCWTVRLLRRRICFGRLLRIPLPLFLPVLVSPFLKANDLFWDTFEDPFAFVFIPVSPFMGPTGKERHS